MSNQRSDAAMRSLSYFKPSSLLFGTLLIFNFFPALWIWSTGWKEDLYFKYTLFEYIDGVNLYLYSVTLFLSIFVLYNLLLGSNILRSKVDGFINRSDIESFGNFRLYKVISYIGIFVTAIYLFDGGYEKLLLFGANVDEWAFRLIGYDDRSRFLIAGLEASRRVLLPLSVSYLFILVRLGQRRGVTGLLLTGAFFQILGAAMTLDRAPILLFFVMFLYVNACLGMTFFKIFRTLLITVAVVLPVAGLTTFLQYNIRAFSVADVLETGQNFLLHRTILVPSIASIELSFVQFPAEADKLLLRFSRLTALVGGTYVGTEDANSIFVTPVGAIADVWRNFGYPGIAVSAIAISAYFRRLDQLMRRVGPVACIVHSFNALSLAFYFVFGTLFSQGVLFQMLVGYVLLSVEAARQQRRQGLASQRRSRVGFARSQPRDLSAAVNKN